MKDNLKEIFQNVNDWLKFAEAKHAGLIVLNSGTIFGILSIYGDYKGSISIPWIIASISFLGLSMVISFISLFPILDNKVQKKTKPDNPNLFFFKSIALLDESDFKKELLKVDPNFSPGKLESDLINQIIINSQITLFKSQLFRTATIITLIGFLIPIIYKLIQTLWHL